MSLSPALDLAPRRDADTMLVALLRSRGLGAAIVAAAVALQAWGHVNPDTSWFTTFAEKVMDGAVPYVDVGDPNPPAAFVVEMPAVALARLLRVPAEAAVVALTLLTALLALAASGRLLQRAGLLPAREIVPAFNAAAFVLLLAPALCFAEREHVVLILLLPFLAVRAARRAAAPPSAADATAAGIAAGLALAFKPYYALPIGCVLVSDLVLRRRPASLRAPEIVAAALAWALAALATLVLCPAYLATLRLASDVYGRAHEAMSIVLSAPPFLATLALLIAVAFTGRARSDPRVVVAVSASLGFTATYLIQAKGWMNHAYPGLALALLACLFVVLRRETDASVRRRIALFALLPGCLAAPLFMGALVDLRQGEDQPGLTAAVARLAPPHPRIAALAQELGIGHPLVRRLGGTWVGRQNCLWLAYAANVERVGTRDPARRAHLQALIDEDAEAFAADVARGRPDVLLVGSRQLEIWARRRSAYGSLFDDFTHAADVGEVEIWLRRTAPAG